MPATCPRDGSPLVEVDRDGVKIDACKSCRGIWLDRGELEKLLAQDEQASRRQDEEDEAFLREVTGGSRTTSTADHAAPAARTGASSTSSKPGFDLQTAQMIFGEYQRHKHGKSRKKKGAVSVLSELLG